MTKLNDNTIELVAMVHLASNGNNDFVMSRFKKQHHKDEFDRTYGVGSADRVIGIWEANK
jgi:hypothetical protein